MAKLLGNNYRLWVETATPGTYAMILGQQSISTSRAASTIDTSTKDDFPYATAAPGLFAYDVTLTGIATLPDTTGFSFVETKFKAQTSWKFQIRKSGAAGIASDAVFECLCNILELAPSYPQNGTVAYTLKLTLATAPTIDTLA
jgi:hypothetical protein